MDNVEEKAGVKCPKCKGENTVLTGAEVDQEADYRTKTEPCEAVQCFCKDCGHVFWD